MVIPISERDANIQTVENDGALTPIYDPSLLHDYIHNDQVAITDVTLGIIGIAGPLTFFVVATSCVLRHQDHSTSDALSAYIISLCCSEFVTEGLKRYVGRLRPNFYAMCAFDEDVLACTASQARINQSRKSFPSGHASLSFCAMTLVSLWLLRIVVDHEILFGKGKGTIGFVFRCFVATVPPMSLATFTAASRVHDFWHHPSDVIGGALIGGLSACFGFRVIFGVIDWAKVAEKRTERRGEGGGLEGRLLESK